MVTDSTIMKVAAMACVSVITVVGVCEMHIDGAFMASMAGIIGGIAGYSIKGLQSK